MVRTLLVRGMLVGIVAGLLIFDCQPPAFALRLKFLHLGISDVEWRLPHPPQLHLNFRQGVLVGEAADPRRLARADGEILAVEGQPQLAAARICLSRRRVVPPRWRPLRAGPESIHVRPRLRFVQLSSQQH